MTFTIDPDLLENNDFQLTDDGSGNLALEAKATGNIFTIDENSSLSDKIESTLDTNLDANGNDITNVNSLNTDQASISQVANIVVKSNTQSVSSTTDTKIIYDSVERGDSNIVEWDEANNKHIIQKDGLYLLKHQIMFKGIASGTEIIGRIRTSKTSAPDLEASVSASGNFVGTGQFGLVISLSAGNEIEWYTEHNSGSSEELGDKARWNRAEVVKLA